MGETKCPDYTKCPNLRYPGIHIYRVPLYALAWSKTSEIYGEPLYTYIVHSIVVLLY